MAEWRVRSTFLAVEHVADGTAASFVEFFIGLAANCACGAAALGGGFGGFRLAARGAAVGEAGLAGAELEFLRADGADFDGKSHRHP
jgi:hypothetical protein